MQRGNPAWLWPLHHHQKGSKGGLSLKVLHEFGQTHLAKLPTLPQLQTRMSPNFAARFVSNPSSILNQMHRKP